MQQKYYRKSTLLLTLTIIIDVLCLLGLLQYRKTIGKLPIGLVVGFVLLIFVLSAIFSYYDMNADKNYIKKCIANGDVALAKICDGSFVRFARDAKLHNHVFWKMNIELYDNDMKMFKASLIDKFSMHQTQIPSGYVFVTYIEGKEDDCLIIPNVIISSIPEYQPLVEDYEKALKPTYLNAYYNDGMILQTYKESIKDQKEYYKQVLENNK